MHRLRINIRDRSTELLRGRLGSYSLLCLCLWSLLLQFPIAAQPPVPSAPQRFERVLWCADRQSGPKLARQAGFTAVQLGRGGDAAPLRALGLRFYLDQPIGKGLLELRDSEWRPVVQEFERTRDASKIVRPSCFAEPGRVVAAATAAAQEVRRVGPEGMLFVALADEASSTRHNGPLDSCQCVHCMRDFRAFLQRRFPNIDALNEALGTHFLRFQDVKPVSTDQLRRRELGDQLLPSNLRPFSVWLDFVDGQFAQSVQAIRESVVAALPGVPVGLTGLAVPGPFGGHDYGRLLAGHTLGEPYDIGGSLELCRSLLPPFAHRYATLFPPDDQVKAAKVAVSDYVRARLMAMVSQGMAGVVVWNDGTVAAEDGAATPFGKALTSTFKQHGAEFDALAGAEVASRDVWLVESHASVRAWWMIDSAQDGMTWVRRLASYEQTHSTSQAARLGWIRLLQDLGHQPYFVTANTLPERLLLERPRCVVLPATLALSDRVIQALSAYVQSGGSLLADHSTAVYDDRLRRRDLGGLDSLFGVEGRSLAWHDLFVREGRSTSRDAGLPAAEQFTHDDVSPPQRGSDTFIERPVGRGRAHYLNSPVCAYVAWRLDEQEFTRARELRRRVRAALRLAGVTPPCEVQGKGLPTCIERVPLRLRDGRSVVAIRVNALQRPALMRRLAQNGPIEIEVSFPRTSHIRELNGKDHGQTKTCRAMLDPFGAAFFEVRQ